MRFILLTVLVSLVVVFVNPYLPYWVVMVGVGFLSILVYPTAAGGFFGGGLGMGLTWLGQSVYLGMVTSSPLPEKVGELMGLGPNLSLGLVTGILGFLLGSFSGLSGVLLRKLVKKRPQNKYKG